MKETVFCLAAMAAAGYGAYTDLKQHKIYNKLTMPAIFAGLMCNLLMSGPKGLLDSLLGILISFLFVLLWVLGMLKAGDAKLCMAVGALAGWRFCGYTMISSVLIGGVGAALLMIFRKTGRVSLKRLKEYFFYLLYTKQFVIYQPEIQSAYFSFGCCLFAGTLVAFWCQRIK